MSGADVDLVVRAWRKAVDGVVRAWRKAVAGVARAGRMRRAES